MFNMIAVFCIIWSLGSNLKTKEGLKHTTPSSVIKKRILKIFNNFPLEGTIFDYYIDFKAKRFKNWKEML